MALKAILFDLDDTLILEQASAEETFLKTCNIAHEQKGIDPQKLYQSVRHHAGELWRASPTITYCRAIGISSWEGLWARFLGDDPNLKALRAWASKYQLEAWSLALLEHGVEDFAQIEHYFEIIIVSGEVGIGKPDPRIFDLALEQLNVEPEKAVMVGDSLSRDIHGAQKAGGKEIWINRCERESENDIVPDIQIKALDELKTILF